MLNFLDRRQDRISQILIHGMSGLIKEEGNFIKRVEGTIDTLSYLPTKKYSVIKEDQSKDPFGEGVGRQPIKVGRFIRKFLSENAFQEFGIKDSDVEKFVNSYKSYFNYDPSKLQIVEGEDVRKYYLEDNYFRPDGYRYGSLWNSCMRQVERNKFMNLYVLNNVKMLVLFSDDNKVRARALIWEDVKEFDSDKTYKFMDRIYTVYDHDVDVLLSIIIFVKVDFLIHKVITLTTHLYKVVDLLKENKKQTKKNGMMMNSKNLFVQNDTYHIY